VAYALFLEGEYQSAIQELNQFMEYYPAHQNIDYAYYLEAVSYYKQVPGQGRDAASARLAFNALEVFLRHFPESQYAQDASVKAREVADMLAANHLSIGRFYQDGDQLLAAINRFQLVVRDYPETVQVPEALHRLAECFTALGVIDEAQQSGRVLASSYPDSDWTEETRTLLASVFPLQDAPAELAQNAPAELAQDAPVDVTQVAGLGLGSVEEASPQSIGDSQKTAVSRLIEKTSVPVSAQEPVRHGGPLFAINLELALQSNDSPAVAMHPRFESRRLYVTRFENNGEIWRRLRLGFFQSKETAQLALADLWSTYPNAWVTRIEPKELAEASGAAIWQSASYDNPAVQVAAAPEPASEAPETGKSYLDLAIPEVTVKPDVGDGASDGQRTVVEEATQVALTPSSPEPEVTDSSLADISGAGSPAFGFRSSDYRVSSSELALLQRWNKSGEGTPVAVGVGLSFAGSDASWGSIESEFNGGTFGLSEVSPAFGKEDEWEQQTSLSSNLQFRNGAQVTLGHSYKGERNSEDENFGLDFVGQSEDWEEDTLNDTTLKIGLWGDRLEFSSLYSVSRHDEASFGDDVVTGQGLFQSLNANLFQGEGISLSISGSYGTADDAYSSSAGGDDDEDSDGSAAPLRAGTEAMDYGLEAEFALGFADLSLSHDTTWETKDLNDDYEQQVSSDYELGLGFDAVDLTVSYNTTVETSGRGEDRDREKSVEYEAEVGYQVQALRGLLGNSFGETFWNVAPDHVSASYGIKQSKASSGSRDETTELGTSASWDWDGGYTSLSYYYSFQDDQVEGSGDNDYRSEGLDFGGGLWGESWTFDAGVSVNRSASLGQWDKSTELGIDPYIYMSYKPEHWPDMSLSGSTGYYKGDYIAYGGTSTSRYWEVSTEFDFAKFWPEIVDSEDESMMLVFQLEGDSSKEDWDAYESSDSNLDYFVGFKIDLTFGE
jgi:hypothetical protein